MPNFSVGNPGTPPRHARYVAGLFVLLIALSSVIGYAVYHHLVLNEEREAEETLRHIADIRSAAVSGWVKERLGDAMVFGSGRFLGETVDAWIKRGAPEDETKRQVREQLNAIRVNYGYVEVAILDTQGRPRISTQPDLAPLDPVGERTVQRAIAAKHIQISSIHFSGEFEYVNQVVDIATPLLHIHEDSAQPVPILFLKANANLPLDPFTQSLPLLSASTEVLLVEIRDDQVIAISVNEHADHFRRLGVLPLSPAQLTAAAETPGAHFALNDAHTDPSVAVAHKIEDVPWFLVATANRDAIRANVHHLAWIVGGAGAGILLLLSSAMLSWWRKKESELRLQTLQAETGRDLLQRQYDYLSKYANDMIVLADADDRILEVNDKTLQVLGRRRDALVGAPLSLLFAPASRAQLEQALDRLRIRGTNFFETEQQRANGSRLPVEISARAIQSGNRQLIQLICRDVTERKEAEAALRESQARLNGIMTSVLDVIWSFSPDFARLNYINPACEQIYGYPVDAFIADPQLWFDTVHPDDLKEFENTLRGLHQERPTCEIEHRIIRSDGQVRWLHCRARLVIDGGDLALRIDGVSNDITQRKSAEQQVQTLAYYDNVTTLPNRALINDRLAQAVHMASRSRRKVAVLFMDLDNFKNVNDSLGHQVGDMLLRAIAECLLQCVREEDTVGRLGGDEFLVVLPDIERGEQAVSVAEKILAATAKPFVLQGQQIHTTISIGISIFPDDGKEPHELIRHADSALYQAKSRGRDNYQFFTQELNYQINRSSTIERQLRRAIESGELSVWYQPQIDTREGRLVGAEALLRWRHDGHDFLTPVEFIPVAEERGLIGRIGEWVLREACRQARQWQAQGPVPVSVNVSPLQFQQKGFASLVVGILNETRLDATCLELEITESSIMRRAPLVATLATTLRSAGVRISIDDFGTGYSSLSYLKQIPIDKIKIDRSFIADMLSDSDDEAITHAIVNLARSLNLRVIAEGVESLAQVERLHAFGCDEVQGHYYSSAVSPETFRELLANRTRFAAVAA